MSLSHALPWLAVLGNRIVRADTGETVLLRGVNRSGLEYSGPDGTAALARAGITESELDQIVVEWGANCIRLPFNQDWALSRPGYDASPYLAAIDQVVEMAARRGAWTLLDLQWLDAVTPRGYLHDGRPNFVPPLPNEYSLAVWAQLAARYCNEPAVLYDVFNEPHDPLPGDPVALEGFTHGTVQVLKSKRVTMREWQPWAMAMLRVIRKYHPAALIFVSGVNWAYNLLGFPLPGIESVVYSTHVYPAKGRDWERAFGRLSRTAPVIAGEWGGGDADLTWGETLLEYFTERQIGWLAWSWSDHPHLVRQAGLGRSYEPTRFGHLVRSALMV